MQLTLYHCPGTRSQRVRWALEELDLDYDLEPIDLYHGQGNSPEYRAINPLGQLPALKVDDKVILESGAIVHWLADRFAPGLLAPPIDSPNRADYAQWMYFAVTNLEGPAWEIVLHRDILPEKLAVKAIIPFAEGRLGEVLELLGSHLSGRDYLLGESFSAADILAGYILMWFPRQVTAMPSLKAYVKRLKDRPAYQRSQRS
ncbi:MAG: glutathione S-transferase family protein [Candidatus Thiodiazotropha sp.]|jgi:glutathione S-transferase